MMFFFIILLQLIKIIKLYKMDKKFNSIEILLVNNKSNVLKNVNLSH